MTEVKEILPTNSPDGINRDVKATFNMLDGKTSSEETGKISNYDPTGKTKFEFHNGITLELSNKFLEDKPGHFVIDIIDVLINLDPKEVTITIPVLK